MKTRRGPGSAASVALAMSTPGALLSALQDRLPKPAQEVIEASRGKDLVLYASGLAFYAMVSIAPLTILTIWIASVILGDERIQSLADAVRRIAPEGVGADSGIRKIAKAGVTVGLPAAIAGLWPATAYGSGVARAFRHLSPGRKEAFKGLRGRGLALIALLPLFVLGGLVGSFVGSTILGDGGLQRVLGIGLALVTGFLGVAIATLLLYKMFPPDALSWQAALRGTYFAASGVSLLSLGYTLYLTQISGISDSYGGAGLGGLVLLAVWLFLSNLLLLVGFQVALQADG